MPRPASRKKGTRPSEPDAAGTIGLVMESFPDPAFVKDRDLRFLWMNAAMARVFGLDSPDDAVGKTEKDFLPEALNRSLSEDDRTVLAGGKPVLSREREWTTPAGEKRWFLEHRIPVVRSGKTVGVAGFARDITATRKTEQDLRNANVLLSGALTKLRQAQQTIVQNERLNALGEMASGIAHDFNNALMPILGYSDLLLANPAILANADESTAILKDMRSAAMDASECVRRLREFYRAAPDTEPACGDLNKQIQTVVVLMRPKWQSEMGAKGMPVTITTDLGDVPTIRAKESQLREMLINLLLNALDAMPKGGTITFRTRTEGKRVVLEITDTGAGMTEEVRRRCIEPFFTTKSTGSGLGLSMAYGFIQRSRGSLHIDSAPGKGTTITIAFLSSDGDAAPEAPPSSETAPVRPMNILVIDDELAARRLYERALTSDGHAVETAASGEEGLARFRGGRFDLVIVDRAMPDVSGDQVVDAIRQSGKAVAVIMGTGFGDIMLDSGELPPGVDVVLSKPVSTQSLREAIAEAVGRRPNARA